MMHIRWTNKMCIYLCGFILLLYGCAEKPGQITDIKKLNTLLENDPENVSLIKQRTRILESQNPDDSSQNNVLIRDYTFLINHGDTSIENYIYRGNAYFRIKGYEHALDDINYAISRNRDVYAFRALLFTYAKKYDSAIIDYQTLIAKDPIKYHALYDLIGDCQAMAGDYAAAVKSYQQYVKSSEGQDFFDKHTDIIELLLVDGEYNAALQHINNIANQSFKYGDTYEAVILYHQGKKKSAKMLLAQSIQKDTTDVLAYYYLAKIAAEDGNHAEAIELIGSANKHGFIFKDIVLADRSFEKLHKEELLKNLTLIESIDSIVTSDQNNRIIFFNNDAFQANDYVAHRMRIVATLPQWKHQYKLLRDLYFRSMFI